MNTFSSIKAKAVSKLPSQANARKQLRDVSAAAISALQTTLVIVKDLGGVTGCPGLQAGVGGLLIFIDAIKVFPLVLCPFVPL
jgi:hypothetical protein